jgi:hypothetical protein
VRDYLRHFWTHWSGPADVRLRHVDCGHFVPLERPREFAAAVAGAAGFDR